MCFRETTVGETAIAKMQDLVFRVISFWQETKLNGKYWGKCVGQTC